MKDIVRKEVLKWLDAGVIYPISESAWASPVQVVPKKGGTIVIKKTIILCYLPEQSHDGGFVSTTGN